MRLYFKGKYYYVGAILLNYKVGFELAEMERVNSAVIKLEFS